MKKWQVRFAVLCDGHLLFFKEERNFRRMQLRDEHDLAEEVGPDLCVDLSQSLLRWFRRGGRSSKRENVIEVSFRFGVKV